MYAAKMLNFTTISGQWSCLLPFCFQGQISPHPYIFVTMPKVTFMLQYCKEKNKKARSVDLGGQGRVGVGVTPQPSG